MLTGILQYAHQLLETSIEDGELVLDATCGNGNDTLFLSQHVGEQGKVLAFDVQEQAIQTTQALMTDHDVNNVSLIHDSHANIEKYINDDTVIGGAVFNLGYLPKSDKSIITEGESTIAAIDSILKHLRKKGLIVLVIYHGHEGGKTEKDLVLQHVTQLDQKQYSVLQYGFINQKNNPPFIVAIQKRKNKGV